MYKKCLCIEILESEFGQKRDHIAVHLMGCPESAEAKEYAILPWYKKLFKINPYHYYKAHLEVLYFPEV